MSDKNNDETNKNPQNLNETHEDGEILTLSDILNEQREIDEDALAVLGGSDEDHCTYSQGYIKRQALYACLTCVPESKDKPEKRAGVCLACSYKCHDGHDLIELYTKRNFRCDCGTSKILAIRCKLDANKMEDNDKNTYNQNFSGVYCTCHRPYPDELDEIQDEMIQCIFCEDWFHSRHLNAKVPDANAFDEMICDSCTLKNDFLNHYSGYCITPTDDANTSNDLNVTDNDVNASTASVTTSTVKSDGVTAMETESATEKSTEEPSKTESASDNEKPAEKPITTDATKGDTTETSKEETAEGKTEEKSEEKNEEKPEKKPPTTEVTSTEGQEVKPTKNDTVKVETEKKDNSINAEINQCIEDMIEFNKNNVQTEKSPSKRRQSNTNDDIPAAKKIKNDDETTAAAAVASTSGDICRKPTTVLSKFTGASFWTIEWRNKLCKCTKCLDMYKENNVEFLLDDEDTVHAYQEKGKAKAENRTTSIHDEAMRAISGMDHVAQIEAVLAYNKLKKKLTEFLTTFVSNEQVITAKDVDTFFQTEGKKD